MKEKWLPVAIFILLRTFACSQEAKTDTIFLFRKIDSNYYQAIYIDSNKNSGYYSKILNNSFDTSDNLYVEGISSLKKGFKGDFPKHHISGIAKSWFPLYLYRNKYYVYAPSEWGANEWVKITGSLFTEFTFNDGPTPGIIKSFKRLNSKHFSLNIKEPFRKAFTTNIYIIDAKNQIAVFEYSGQKEPHKYRLMVAGDKVKLFPVIVNYCKDQNCLSEFKFDKPNYKKLLQKFNE